MSAREIIAVAEREQFFADRLAGATPHQTLKSKLSVAIRTHGTDCRFVRTAPGRFFLRDLIGDEPIYEAPRYRPPDTKERVLGFSAARLDRLGRFHGIKTAWRLYLGRLLRDGFEARDRYAAEETEDFKQVITYVLVTRGPDLLAYRRGAFNRVEHSLRGSDCVGFGGHLAELDLNLFNVADQGLGAGAARELAEELQLPEADHARLAAGEGLEIIGLLNDDSSQVGRRHFAVVFRYEVSSDPAWRQPARGEKAITRLRWLSAGGDVRLNDYEYWSQPLPASVL